jgi:hypothetical protein
METEESKYHKILLQEKTNCVRKQNYELCAYLRNVETTYFVVVDKNGENTKFSNYIGFDKKEMIKSIQSIPKNTPGSLEFIRDFNLNQLLD